ncbi:hypothetical protein TYRP_001295 [Tyrophagus putrescentiae]|nr:hypothetical protein TYRP_001295 [Tyrophagus putrescentiae]
MLPQRTYQNSCFTALACAAAADEPEFHHFICLEFPWSYLNQSNLISISAVPGRCDESKY